MEFLVQCICLIYTRLLVHATQVLAYPQGHIYYMPLSYSMMSELKTMDLVLFSFSLHFLLFSLIYLLLIGDEEDKV